MLRVTPRFTSQKCSQYGEIVQKSCRLTHKLAHGHFGGMQVACLLWQRVCSEKFPSRTSLSGGFGKEAFLCVPLLLGSKRAVSPKCGHEPFGVVLSHLFCVVKSQFPSRGDEEIRHE